MMEGPGVSGLLFHSRFYHCMQLEVLHSSGFDDNVVV
jgi:hypothetical protein